MSDQFAPACSRCSSRDTEPAKPSFSPVWYRYCRRCKRHYVVALRAHDEAVNWNDIPFAPPDTTL